MCACMLAACSGEGSSSIGPHARKYERPGGAQGVRSSSHACSVRVLVHRKGATRAFAPHHPLIPEKYQASWGNRGFGFVPPGIVGSMGAEGGSCWHPMPLRRCLMPACCAAVLWPLCALYSGVLQEIGQPVLIGGRCTACLGLHAAVPWPACSSRPLLHDGGPACTN